MANGKIVKYKKVYKITVEGKTDTAHPEDTPLGLETARNTLYLTVGILDSKYKHRNVTIKEIKR